MRSVLGKVRRFRIALATIVALVVVGLIVAVPGGASEASDITEQPVKDFLKRTESPLSAGGGWLPLKWDNSTSEHNTGAVTEAGWRAFDAYPIINGAWWAEYLSNKGPGTAATITMAVAPGAENKYMALWLNMPWPEGDQSGYQLSWTWVGPNLYAIVLAKWVEGKKTALASITDIIAPGTTMAIFAKGGTVSAWRGEYYAVKQFLSAGDSTYSSGFAGIEASGNMSRAYGFRTGSIRGPYCAQAGTRLYAGECWGNLYSETSVTARQAAANCATKGGTLPNVLEFASFAVAPPEPSIASEGEWSNEIGVFSFKNAFNVLTVLPGGDIDKAVFNETRRYRCVYPVTY